MAKLAIQVITALPNLQHVMVLKWVHMAYWIPLKRLIKYYSFNMIKNKNRTISEAKLFDIQSMSKRYIMLFLGVNSYNLGSFTWE